MTRWHIRALVTYFCLHNSGCRKFHHSRPSKVNFSQ